MPELYSNEKLCKFLSSIVKEVTDDKGYPCTTRWQFCTINEYLIFVIESTDKEVETYVKFLLNKHLYKRTGYSISNRYTISPGIEPDYGVAEWEVFGQQVTISDLLLINRNSKKRGFSDWMEFVAYVSYGIEQIESDWEVHTCSAVPAYTESATTKGLLGTGVDLLKRWTKKISTRTSSPSTTGSPEETGEK